MTMPLDLAVRVLRALAAFDPDATMNQLPEKVDELEDALQQFRSTLVP